MLSFAALELRVKPLPSPGAGREPSGETRGSLWAVASVHTAGRRYPEDERETQGERPAPTGGQPPSCGPMPLGRLSSKPCQAHHPLLGNLPAAARRHGEVTSLSYFFLSQIAQQCVTKDNFLSRKGEACPQGCTASQLQDSGPEFGVLPLCLVSK